METDEPTPNSRPEEYMATENSVYPQPPTMYGGCRLLINEVAALNDDNEYSFIEHRRVCPRGKRQKTNKLTGYVEVMMEAGETGYQISFSDLSDFDLQSVTETDRRTINQYFTIGSEEIGSHMKISDMQAPDYIKRGIPKALETTICIALLYIPDYHKKPGRDLIKKLKLKYIGQTIPAKLDSERMNIIKRYVQDALVIGPPCEIADCEFFFDLLQKKTQIDGIHGRLIPQPDTEIQEGGKPYQSINRCTVSSFPMQQDSYVPGPPSPNKANSCPAKVKKAPFDLHGSRLQSSAQKLVVNSKYFFDESPPGPLNLEGSSVEKTAQVLGIHENTVRKVLSNWKSDDMCTPGVKRPNRKEPVMDRFDGFRVEQAKRIIQESYKRQVAPLLDNIFQEFLKQVREEEERERLTGADIVTFKCSLKTFSKFLKKIGFRYGKINDRDVILQRSDIVAKRFEYLTAIRANRRLESPNPIEFVRKDIKHEVRKQNRDQSVKAAVETAKAVMGAYTADQWKAHVNHVKK
jgi:transposase